MIYSISFNLYDDLKELGFCFNNQLGTLTFSSDKIETNFNFEIDIYCETENCYLTVNVNERIALHHKIDLTEDEVTVIQVQDFRGKQAYIEISRDDGIIVTDYDENVQSIDDSYKTLNVNTPLLNTQINCYN